MVDGVWKNQMELFDGAYPIVVDISNGKFSKDDLCHDEFSDAPIHAMILAHLDIDRTYQVPGVFRQYFKETYDEAIKHRSTE
jgi:hypothetical protein